MKIAIAVAALAGLIVPMSAAQAATAAPHDTPPAASTAPATTAAPVLVARWNFDAGATAGRVADTSGHGAPALTARGADQGALSYEAGPTGGKYVAFPALCSVGATACPRAMLEAPNDGDLNPGTRLFRWGATIRVLKSQVRGSSNIMQKGTNATGSQWKMQIGQKMGRAQCVVIGVGSPAVYMAHSTNPITDGAWHKILCQRSGTTLAIFVDGVQQGTVSVPAAMSISNSMPLRIGGPNFNTSSDMYHGQLDDVYAELG
ncbi:LamG domain-containing protein [Actinoplanes sp. KI2]|uniref:LamG domain-containing protein n=1 Tax=Actinoplanes sp. KI2 TaxID=2983315 RepID=UPI0021D5E0A0|nr:LamG domain-containing protein [Actinoplanes sp. KI2]MCU7726631.1 LamG domain-containing protein [Actinoplanes sp. KI2]